MNHRWHEALQRLSPEDILAHVPQVFPVSNRTEVPGVSRFPMEDWQRSGCPTLTLAGWCAMCQVIAAKDLKSLRHIFELCSDPEGMKRRELQSH